MSLVLFALLSSASSPAVASTATLKRSVSNITQAPLDLVLSPMVALLSEVRGMREQDDPVAVRVLFFLPGFAWNTWVDVGSSIIRFITGGFEFIPGLVLLPFDADLGVLFSPVERGAALVEFETPCCIDVKFGIDYTGTTGTTATEY